MHLHLLIFFIARDLRSLASSTIQQQEWQRQPNASPPRTAHQVPGNHSTGLSGGSRSVPAADLPARPPHVGLQAESAQKGGSRLLWRPTEHAGQRGGAASAFFLVRTRRPDSMRWRPVFGDCEVGDWQELRVRTFLANAENVTELRGHILSPQSSRAFHFKEKGSSCQASPSFGHGISLCVGMDQDRALGRVLFSEQIMICCWGLKNDWLTDPIVCIEILEELWYKFSPTPLVHGTELITGRRTLGWV